MCVCLLLQASTFQMAVLLQYNSADSFSVQQLQESTQLKMVSSRSLARSFARSWCLCGYQSVLTSRDAGVCCCRTRCSKCCRSCSSRSCWSVTTTTASCVPSRRSTSSCSTKSQYRHHVHVDPIVMSFPLSFCHDSYNCSCTSLCRCYFPST